MLEIALAACSEAAQRVVVGNITVPTGVMVTCEEPPFGGPVAGVEAGLAALAGQAERAPWTLLLAADLPGAEPAVGALRRFVPDAENDGVCLAEPDGRLQWLLGIYRTPILQRRWRERGDPPITALYRMLSPLDLVGVQCDPALLADVDTPADLERARQGRTTEEDSCD